MSLREQLWLILGDVTKPIFHAWMANFGGEWVGGFSSSQSNEKQMAGWSRYQRAKASCRFERLESGEPMLALQRPLVRLSEGPPSPHWRWRMGGRVRAAATPGA
jgi:hypothetical protein